MGIEKDLQRLFQGALSKHGGNKAAVAEILDVNPVTFWGWATGKRKPLSQSLCKAIDNAGGVLLIPGEPTPARQNSEDELTYLRDKVESLSRENAVLHKLVNKYEEAEEREKNEVPQEEGRTTRPASIATTKAEDQPGTGI